MCQQCYPNRDSFATIFFPLAFHVLQTFFKAEVDFPQNGICDLWNATLKNTNIEQKCLTEMLTDVMNQVNCSFSPADVFTTCRAAPWWPSAISLSLGLSLMIYTVSVVNKIECVNFCVCWCVCVWHADIICSASQISQQSQAVVSYCPTHRSIAVLSNTPAFYLCQPLDFFMWTGQSECCPQTAYCSTLAHARWGKFIFSHLVCRTESKVQSSLIAVAGALTCHFLYVEVCVCVCMCEAIMGSLGKVKMRSLSSYTAHR